MIRVRKPSPERSESRRTAGWRAVVFVLLLTLTSPSFAGADGKRPTRAARDVSTVLKVLTYDAALSDRCGDTLQVVLLYPGTNKRGLKDAEAIQTALMEYAARSFVGMVVEVLLRPVEDPTSLAGELPPGGIAAVYLARGFKGELDSILDLCRQRRMLSITTEEEYVTRGVSVVVLKDSSLPVLVNLRAAREEGARLEASFLQVCQVLR